MENYTVNVSDDVLTDLKQRLANARWPDEIGANWQYGTDLTYLKTLCHYWQTDYDWRKHEAEINALPNFLYHAEPNRKLHFIHARSENPNALPLLMTHGWPGSIVEFLKIIPLLTDPESFGGKKEDAFHVVCPSIPGYGFSDAPSKPGFDQKCVAQDHVKLMSDLGYDRYVVQGGDWGSAISSWTAKLDPNHVAALHLTLIFAGYPKDSEDPMAGVTDDELKRLKASRNRMSEGTGYQAIQGTKPQTLGYGLNDSPVGLAAWILEKFHGWSHHDGNLEQIISRDELLTNIMLYWISGTITSSTRLYYESAHSKNNLQEHGRIATPTGYALFPGELYQPPRAWAEQHYNIEYWSIQPEGGHFAALEQPDLLVKDLRAFFRKYR